MIRIELIDRWMAIAAQGMLALVPMLVVLASFLPTERRSSRSNGSST